MPTEEQVRQQVREILTRVLPDVDAGVDDDADIFAMGMDSISTVLLINEIEERYAITLEGDDIPYDRFRTIAGIASFVVAQLRTDAAG